MIKKTFLNNSYKALIAVMLLFSTYNQANAVPLVFEVGTVSQIPDPERYVSPAGVGPWLTASFETIQEGSVRLTLMSHLQEESEFFYYFAFSWAPEFNSNNRYIFQEANNGPQAHIITPVSGSPLVSTIQWMNQRCGVLPDCPEHFNLSDVNSFLITAPGLTAEDFNYTNVDTSPGMNGYFGPDAHVGANLRRSRYEAEFTWLMISDGSALASVSVSVPEPGTLWLIGAGMAGFVIKRRLLKRKTDDKGTK